MRSPVDPSGLVCWAKPAKPAKPANHLWVTRDVTLSSSISRWRVGKPLSNLDLERQRAVFCRGAPCWAQNGLVLLLTRSRYYRFGHRAPGVVCQTGESRKPGIRQTSTIQADQPGGIWRDGKSGFRCFTFPPLVGFVFPPTAFQRLILLAIDEREMRKLTARRCQTRRDETSEPVPKSTTTPRLSGGCQSDKEQLLLETFLDSVIHPRPPGTGPPQGSTDTNTPLVLARGQSRNPKNPCLEKGVPASRDPVRPGFRGSHHRARWERANPTSVEA